MRVTQLTEMEQAIGAFQKAIDRRGASAMPSFDFDAPTVSSPSAPSLKRQKEIRAPKADKLKRVVIVHTVPLSTLSLFEEEDHPRARAGVPTINPETGKEIQPGQFAPKPKTGEEDAPKRRRRNADDAGGGPSLFDEPAGEPSEDVPGDAAGRNPGSGGNRRAGALQGSGRGTDSGREDVAPGGAGGGAGNVSAAAGRDAGSRSEPESVSHPVAELHATPQEEADDFDAAVDFHQFQTPSKQGHNYRITEADAIGQGGEKQKFQDNLQAILTLKKIEGEGRFATPEEQALLVKYTGWGWAGQLFHPSNDHAFTGAEKFWNSWKPQHDQLKALLTPEEWKAASESAVNAHYTAPAVVSAMWNAVQRLGFTGGRVLEPAAGVGHFFGLMPGELWGKSPVSAVELDSLSGRICAQLYQAADVHIQGFQNADTPDHFYDLAISNVPFGNYPVVDKLFDKPGLRFLGTSIHNYFFAKALTKVRAGGLVAFITSNYTLDSTKAKRVREYLAANADLVGAIRLPNDAFKGNAGTEVTTDIIFLRKRGPNETPAGEGWAEVGMVDTPDGQAPINEYFILHPEMMLGKMTLQGTMYRDKSPALVSDGRDLGTALQEAIARLPQGVYQKPTTEATKKEANFREAEEGLRIGSYVEENGQLFQVIPGERKLVGADEVGNGIYVNGANLLEPTGLAGKTAERVRAMIPLRDATRHLLEVMADPHTSEERYLMARSAMNYQYEKFVREHGILHASANLRAFAGDPDIALLCALEHFDKDAGTAKKSDIFTTRTIQPPQPITKANSSQEALLYTLNESHGLDWDRMAALTGKSAEFLQADLARQGLVYHNPQGAWETHESYLSGDVRAKLKAAQAAAKLEPRYQQNVDALLAVQPQDLSPGEIEVKLGAGFIKPDFIRDFIHHIIGLNPTAYTKGQAKVDYLPSSAVWVVGRPSQNYEYSAQNRHTWGTNDFLGTDLIEMALNMKTPTVYDRHSDGSSTVNAEATTAARAKQQEIKDEFKRWLYEDENRATEVAHTYNTDFNCHRERAFSGSHLSLPGLSEVARRNLNPHIKDAVWRQLQSPNTLLDHCVGAGKTWSVAIAAIEMRRLGLARKPMITVPNHLVGQWAAEITKLYPNAKVLMATKKDFEKQNRRKLMAKIATGDWDAVVIAHSSFSRIPMQASTEQEFYQKQITELNNVMMEVAGEDGTKSKTWKELDKQRKRLEAKLQKRMDAQKGATDDFIPFEQLGVDRLFVDEAHMYKNLWFPTKMQRVKGLPNSESNRAFDMYMKCQHLQKRNNGGGVVFATGTPITNTIAEMFTMQRYLDGDWLKEKNLSHFDAWANQFGDTQTSVEYTVAGQLKPTQRFNRFFNVPELATAFRRFADVKTQQDLKLPVPDHERIEVVADPSEEQTAYVKKLAERAESLTTKRIDPSQDNMLKITSDGRKNSLDPRLINPLAADNPTSKINLCVGHVARVHQETAANRSTQCIFLDMGTPKAKAEKELDAEDGPDDDDENIGEEATLRGSVYSDIKQKLIRKGVPEKDIAFIHDAKSDAEKEELIRAMREGRIRVLIGSTEKMGTGMNAQDRMIALHHLDCPWRPDMLEQREGRIIRKGNQNKKVQIYTYATSGEKGALSMDAFMWQTVEGKARAIASILSGDPGQRTTEDIGDMVLTAAQMKALSSGNPWLIRQVELESQIRTLGMQKNAHDKAQWKARTTMQALPGKIASAQARLTQAKEDAAYRAAHKPEKFGMAIHGTAYDSAEAAGIELLRLVKTMHGAGQEPQEVGQYAGHTLFLAPDSSGGSLYVGRAGRPGYIGGCALADADSGRSVIASIQKALDQPGKQMAATETELEGMQRDQATIGAAVKAFPHAEKLAELERSYAAIMKEIAAENKKSEQVVGAPEEDAALQKALVLDKTGKWSGQASAPMASHAWMHTPGGHADNLHNLSWAASKVPGLAHKTSRYQGSSKPLNAAGQVVGVTHAYEHHFESATPWQAAAALRSHLGGGTDPDLMKRSTFHTQNALGDTREHVRLSLNHQGNVHHFTIHHVTPLDRRLQRDVGQKTLGQHVRVVGNAVRSGAMFGAKHLAGLPKALGRAAGKANVILHTDMSKLFASKGKALTSDPAHTAPIHAVAGGFRAKHWTSEVNPAKKNALGGKTDRAYSHWYNHKTPQVGARKMAASFEAAGHSVSGINQKRVYLGDGAIRHQYSFNVTHPDGGATHTVNLFRE